MRIALTVVIILAVIGLMTENIAGWIHYNDANHQLQQACQVLHVHHLTSEGC